MSKSALITGISGQDGAYLASYLLKKGYKVYGGTRRSASGTLWRLKELDVVDDVEIVDLELLEESNVNEVVRSLQVDELYNLGAQSFVGVSFAQPILTAQTTGLAVSKLLEAVRRYSPHTKFYQASSSEQFGLAQETPQSESTPFYPRSPYAVSKLFAHWSTINYREAHDLFCCCGILFNHESPLRGEEFVTRKITKQLAEIKAGQRNILRLGNMEARRDWGFAGDYVEAMWQMLQVEEPEEFVIATGEMFSVRDFVNQAAQALDLQLAWEGEGNAMKAIDRKSNKVIVEVDPKFFREAEVNRLKGDSTKALRKFGWKPTVHFGELVEMMVRADWNRINT